MREHGLQGAFLRKGWKGGSTKQNPRHIAAPDLVDRHFNADAPNRLWVADLTRIITGEGVVWLSSVRDAFSNKVVGWATAARADTALVLTALDYALRSRNVQDDQLIHPSDKGWAVHGAAVHSAPYRCGHRPVDRQRRRLLRQRARRESVVDYQDRADLLGRHRVRHSR